MHFDNLYEGFSGFSRVNEKRTGKWLDTDALLIKRNERTTRELFNLFVPQFNTLV